MHRLITAASAAMVAVAALIAGGGPAQAADPTVPGIPVDWVAATAGDGSARISWESPDSTGGRQITAYVVQVTDDNGTTWIDPAPDAIVINPDTRRAALSGLVNGTAYRFRVAAVNDIGRGPWLVDSPSVTPVGLPGRPAAWVSATPVDGGASLAWTAPADDGGTPITGYRVERTSDGGATWQVAVKSTGTAGTSTVVRGLVNGTSYRFRVAALNAVGAGPALANSPRVVPAWPDLTITLTAPQTQALGWPMKVSWAIDGGPTKSSYATRLVIRDAAGEKLAAKPKISADGTTGSASITLHTAGSYTVKVKVVATSASDPEKTEKSSTTSAVLGEPTFQTRVTRVTAAGVPYSYRAGCPVGPDMLRTIAMPYWDFDGKAQLGRMVVRARVVDDILFIFDRIYASGFRIYSMIPIDAFYAGGTLKPDAADRASMRANNTSAFNCRPVVGYPGQVSPHSSGEALDINPFQNPYVTDKTTYPSGSGEPYHVNRKDNVGDIGVMAPKSPLVKAFFKREWVWGANWRLPDYQHWQSRYPMTYPKPPTPPAP